MASWDPPSVVSDMFSKEFSKNSMELDRTGNAPVAGARFEEELERGEERYQLYSLATPNGQKVSIMLEELGVGYDAFKINIGAGEQFSTGFTKVNPNGKIPALVDTQSPGGGDYNVMETASILLYLAEQHDKFLPKDFKARHNVMQWLFFQMGSAPYLGQFNHFFSYAPKDKVEARQYGVERYGMECKRVLSVLENELKMNQFLGGDEYSIADIANYPWAKIMVEKERGSFLEADDYPSVKRWVDEITARPAVERGLTVCGFSSELAKPWLK
mmetsp:Transcript_3515/g.6067  ORF Transcript_3515/g.6067 Transcript_3515/m.6067 type:complete len:272 (-) Transcript_3515:44-859(-)|eukprot:CAMPEP_0184549336 /NCGR_PEP_ID=MMETSP0199_2-20130426/9470_1 /TAXON_ID=1112570 /ORGANISM="Thraustochytrium sp., Strain LLF1b" /LENGTH=271 /DNA_ID=CAMNT_0026944053 /DNA_START=85 /DNA_END=900 /DNA_ORIENTATION=-